MPITRKHQDKVIKSLYRLMRHERKELRKIRLLAWGLSLSGGIFLGASGAAIWESGGGSIWYWAFGAVGGYLVGLSGLYFSSYAQWPTIKGFIDIDALEKANETPRS